MLACCWDSSIDFWVKNISIVLRPVLLVIWVDTSTKLAVVALTVMVLSAGLFFSYLPYCQMAYPARIGIEVNVLSEKPEKFVVLQNPDPYLARAIADPEGHVTVKLGDTSIHELILNHNTNNFQYKGQYYQLYVMAIDAFPPVWLMMSYAISWVTLPASAVALMLIVMVKLMKKQKQKVEG